MPFSSLGDILHRLTAHKGMSKHIESPMILEYFMHAVREKVGDHARSVVKPLSIREGTITVAVEDSDIVHTLIAKEQELIQFMNAKAGKEIVQRIRLLS